jgi:hypothetical protein
VWTRAREKEKKNRRKRIDETKRGTWFLQDLQNTQTIRNGISREGSEHSARKGQLGNAELANARAKLELEEERSHSRDVLAFFRVSKADTAAGLSERPGDRDGRF